MERNNIPSVFQNAPDHMIKMYRLEYDAPTGEHRTEYYSDINAVSQFCAAVDGEWFEVVMKDVEEL